VHIFKRSLLVLLGVAQIFVLLAAAVKPARAYVDPGSGLLFFQMGGSMLAGALFVMRARIRKLFGIKPKVQAEAVEISDNPELRSGTRG
jgi:hypothetical protein